MKTILSLVFVSFLSFMIVGVNAQTKTDHHAKVAEHHAKALEHTAALKDGSGMTKKEMADHAKKAGEHLNKAIEHHAKVTKSAVHKEVANHHVMAKEHHKALTKELSNEKPDEAKVKKHAMAMHEELNKAATKHAASKH